MALTCSTIYSVNGAYLTALDRRRFIVWNAVGAVFVNVGTNLFAIPRWGAVGASWTTAATEGFLLVASTVVMARAAQTPLWRLGAPVLAVVGLAVVLAWWASVAAGWGVLLLGAGVGLGFAALAVRAFLPGATPQVAAAAADIPCA